jgi:cold shock CspA family protein
MASTTGTIKRKTDKGFGFIAAADGTEYFFSSVRLCRDEL